MFIIILSFIIAYFLYGIYRKEKFDLDNLKYTNSKNLMFNDNLFNDVIMYKSDQKDLLKAGIYECIEKCNGTCVEYGVTGNAFCFPK